MNTNLYSNRDEAVRLTIIEPIEAGIGSTDDFDIDAIANQTLAYDDGTGEDGSIYLDERGYYSTVDSDEFWAIVAANAQEG